MDYLESTVATLFFDILICGEWLGTNHRQVFNATLTGSVMDGKCNLQFSKLNIQNIIYGNVSFLILSISFLTTFMAYILTLGMYGHFALFQ